MSRIDWLVQHARHVLTRSEIEYADWGCSWIRGCKHGCTYCVDENTEVLMGDLSTRKIKDVSIGDTVIGVSKGTAGIFHLSHGTVLAKKVSEKVAYEIMLANGVSLVCSGDHKWLSNRGWKYTTGTMAGKNRRCHLTTQNAIRQIYMPLPSHPSETEDFKRGYLRGLIDGDGILKIYPVKRPGCQNYLIRQFRITMEDEEPLKRATQYLADFGVRVDWFQFLPGSKGIRTSDRARFEQIEGIVQLRDSIEFLRGYVSGFFDAEGSFRGVTIRMGDTKKCHQDIVTQGLDAFQFSYTREASPKGKMLMTRVKGTMFEIIRFFQIFDPANTCRRRIAEVRVSYSSRITLIRPLNKVIRMVDIETSCETFVANGFIAHNCYQRSIFMVPYWDWVQAKEIPDCLNMLARDLTKLPCSGTVMVSNSTDPFQRLYPADKVQISYYTVPMLAALCSSGKFRTVMVVTKSSAVKDHVPALSVMSDGCELKVALTFTTYDADWIAMNEPFSSSPFERNGALHDLYDAGIHTVANVEPIPPGYDPSNIVLDLRDIAKEFIFGSLNPIKKADRLWYKNLVPKLIDLCKTSGLKFLLKKELKEVSN